jgi:hypothetical protein
MKKVRYLAGIAGLVPAAAAMAIPPAAHAAAAGSPAGNAARPGKSISLHPVTDATPAVPACQGSLRGYRSGDVGIHVCQRTTDSYVYWTQESVYNPARRAVTWRLHVSGRITQHYLATLPAGWHSHKFTMSRGITHSICVGASNTPGYPCLPAAHVFE